MAAEMLRSKVAEIRRTVRLPAVPAPRLLHGGRALNYPRRTNLHRHQVKVDPLSSEILEKTMTDRLKRDLLGASIQDFISDHRRMASPRLALPLLVGGIFAIGFSIQRSSSDVKEISRFWTSAIWELY